MPPLMIYDIVMCIMVFIFGSVIGSFLNVVILRTPLHMSIVSGPSHCFSCGNKLKPYDMVPIFSWIILGGKCRKCKAKISPRYMIIELLTALMFLLAYIRFGISLHMLVAIIFFSLLIVLSCIDIDHLEIPYWCTITIAALGIVTFFTETNMPWWEHLLGAVVISLPFAIFALFGAMGGGDVQLMAASGFMLGFKVVPAAFIGIVLGGIYAVFFKVSRSKRDKEKAALVKDIFSEWVTGKMADGKKDIVVAEYEKSKCKVMWDIFDEGSWNIPAADTTDAKTAKSLSEKAEETESSDKSDKPDKRPASNENVYPADVELEAKLTEALCDIPEKDECVMRIVCENGIVTKVKFQQRMAFGAPLGIGLAAGLVYGEAIIQWYLGLMGIR